MTYTPRVKLEETIKNTNDTEDLGSVLDFNNGYVACKKELFEAKSITEAEMEWIYEEAYKLSREIECIK